MNEKKKTTASQEPEPPWLCTTKTERSRPQEKYSAALSSLVELTTATQVNSGEDSSPGPKRTSPAPAAKNYKPENILSSIAPYTTIRETNSGRSPGTYGSPPYLAPKNLSPYRISPRNIGIHSKW
jgi:hypothetical protein